MVTIGGIELNDRTYRISERIHREILSLPMSPLLTDEEVKRVIDVLNAYSLNPES